MALFKQLKIALSLLILMTILTGIIYPLVVMGIAQLMFPRQANGSLIKLNDKWIGSQLIGQSFTQDKYFWSRPSATSPFPYNAARSSGSNYDPSNPDFLALVKSRAALLHHSDPEHQKLLPVDLVTSSASGLDPEISPLAAFYQVPRVAKARGIPAEQLLALIQKYTESRSFGILGNPRINILKLNLGLDQLTLKVQSHE